MRFATLAVLSIASAPALAQIVGGLELAGSVTFETGFRAHGHELGGLSGCTCAPAGSPCWMISDDRGESGPARFFTAEVDLGDGRLDDGDVRFTGVVTLTDASGNAFSAGTVDPEGIALASDGSLWISSEGVARRGIAPWVRRFAPDGRQLGELPLPAGLLPATDPERGVRNNLGFEPLALSPDGAWLYTATENALAQEGPAAGLGVGSPSRILRFSTATGELAAAYLLWVDAIDRVPAGFDPTVVSGLVDLLAVDEETLLGLERAFVTGLGNRIRLYRISLAEADDIHAGDPQAAGIDPRGATAAAKTLVADLAQFGLAPDNLEGLAFGPRLPDGRRSLLLVGDNNFNPLQRTQIVALAVSDLGSGELPRPLLAPTIAAIQGAGLTSPHRGHRVARVPGVVTAVRPAREGKPGNGFWMQDPVGDRDPATSEGLFVATGYRAPAASLGDRVEVTGWIEEAGEAPQLSVTAIGRAQVRILAGGQPLPEPVKLTAIPPIVDDDALSAFEPSADALDLYESLEGMRVAVAKPVVTGPTSRYGEIFVLPDGGAGITHRSAAGGALLTEGGPNPQRLAVAGLGVDADVGDRLGGAIVGVLDYAFGSYRIVAQPPLPAVVSAGRPPQATALRGDRGHLTVATFNVENLSAASPPGKIAAVGRAISDGLGGPDIVALQEIQDDTGPADDGVTSAARTIDLLVAAIAAAGGPRYVAYQVDPRDGEDGGEPGGNIRVAFLVDPRRVEVEVRGAAGPGDAAALNSEAGALLALNPVRVAPADPAFQSAARGQEGSRKPLALEVRFGARTIVLVNNHFVSKRGDDPLFGAMQPPGRPSEDQRRDQAAAVHLFVETVLAADPEAAVIVLGDLNEHEFRPPLRRLSGSRLVNLVERLPAAERYTYVFQGSAQVLDHILVTESLAPGAEVDAVHLAADFAVEGRASDHDPLVARLRIGR